MIRRRAKANPYYFKGDMSAWLTGRTTNSHIVVFGSSIGAGAGADAPRSTNGWAWQLLAALKTLYGNGGEFLGSWNDLVDVNELLRWTITAGWNSYDGCHGELANHETPGTATATLNFTSLDVFNLIGGVSGEYTIKIDAEAPAAIGGPGGISFTKTNYARAAGNHTVQLGAPAAGYAFFEGVSARNANGLISLNSSVSGGTAGTFTGSLAGLYYVELINLLPACLAVISLSTNAYWHQEALVDYESAVDTIVNKIGSTVYRLLVTEPCNGTPETIPQSAYDAINSKIAHKYNCGYININGLWKDYTNAKALGYMGEADPVHPLQGGHDNIKSVIYNFLTSV